MKKTYVNPTTEIIKFHPENSVAAFIGTSEATVDADDAMSSEDDDYEEDDWDE